MKYNWKGNKKFAFTIVDDTDGATVENIKPIYDYLYQKGMLTTKTVWVYPPRDYFPGESLENSEYCAYVKNLKEKGFEIALHDAGSGEFSGTEIRAALEKFKNIFGDYPKMNINHGDNPSGMYWCGKRFSAPVAKMYDFYKKKKGTFVESKGDVPESASFWGGACKEHIKYIRNRVYGELNLLKRDKYTPYREKRKDTYSNYWFSSSDAMTADMFVKLLSRKNVDKLEKEHGCAIIYTHFGYGFVDENGDLRKDVRDAIDYIAAKDGWFAPASEILDFLLQNKKGNEYISDFASLRLDILWILERVYRKFRDNI